MKKPWVLSYPYYPLSTQRRLWSDWADAQADLSLRWAQCSLCWFCHVAGQIFRVLPILIIRATSWENPAHPCSLISAFVVQCLDSIIPLVSIAKISSLYLASMTAQAGLSLPWSGFLVTRLILCQLSYTEGNCYSLSSFSTCSSRHTLNMLNNWAPPSEFVSSSIPSWQSLTAHAQPFRGAMDLAFCLKVPLDSLLVWASSGGSGETARMRRLAWTFAARIGDKYQIRLTRSN